MPAFGGLTPGFERYGGGAPALQRIVESLNSQRGTAYNTDQTSNVYIENMAIARALAECWSNNQRMANQWDPTRMTDFIPRWEKILGLYPAETDTDADRRTRIGKAFARVTQIGIYQEVHDQLVAILGPIFVEITITDSASARVWTPDVTWDVGLHDPTHKLNFMSSVAHLAIQVVQPSYMSDETFYSTLGLINPMLDNLLPAWVTFNWYRNNHGVKGFFLDERNLNEEVFE